MLNNIIITLAVVLVYALIMHTDQGSTWMIQNVPYLTAAGIQDQITDLLDISTMFDQISLPK